MPLFEYRCSACSHLEELLQKHGDAAPARCPACNKKGSMHKEISLTSFQLKGGGWYKDLYASAKPDSGSSDSSSSGSDAGSASSTASSTASAATPAAKADAKSDSKPAPAADKKASKPAAKAPAKKSGGKGKSSASAA